MQWQGPYPIVEKFGLIDYRMNIKGKMQLFHANMLRKYIQWDDDHTAASLIHEDGDRSSEDCLFLTPSPDAT